MSKRVTLFHYNFKSVHEYEGKKKREERKTSGAECNIRLITLLFYV